MAEASIGGAAAPEIAGFDDLEEIGKGGYSRVYRARQVEFDRHVAIKVLNEQLKDDAAVAAFEHECRVMGALWDHPNIVTVFASAFTSDSRPCIVMRLFHEGSYQQLLRRSGPIEVAEALRVGIRMAGALATANAAGVVHGDVKPQNIFKSSYGEPALGDFGIAALIGAGDGEVPRGFSVHYVAPEAVYGDVAPPADQYSLAATLFTMLVGRRPFELDRTMPGDSRIRVLKRVLREPAPHLPMQFGRPLVDVVRRAMSRDPEARFGDLAEFGAALCDVEREMGLPRTTLPVAQPRVPDVEHGEASTHEYAGIASAERSGPSAPSQDRSPSRAATAGSESGSDTEAEAGDPRSTQPSAAKRRRTARPLDIDAGLVRLSDGRTAILDDDLVIGRNPEREQLVPGQRAIVLGIEDRTVSRRHIELRRERGTVTAVCSGQITRLVRGGESTRIPAGSSVRLQSGDTIYFGETSWARFEASEASSAGSARPLHEPAETSRDPGNATTRMSRRASLTEVDDDVRDNTTGTLPAVELRSSTQAGAVADEPSQHSGIRGRMCARCGNLNPPESTVCIGPLGCGNELPSGDDSLRWIPQPVPGSIHLSDGVAANIDANLMIGRNPMRDQLEEGMRGIVHGVDDLAVSRQQFELRRDGWDVVVISRGGRTLLDRAGRLSNLARAERVELQSGDVLRYGNGAWCRYDDVLATPPPADDR